MDLRISLLDEINKIAGRMVGWDENLLADAIDSLSLVEIVNLVDRMASEKGIAINIDALIGEEKLTAEMIFQSLTKESSH